MKRRLFVVGAGRSGTKFLMNILNGSPAVHLAPEIHYFSSLIHDGFRKNLRRRGKGKGGFSVADVLSTLESGKSFGTYWRRDIRFDREALQRAAVSGYLSDKAVYDFIIEHDREVYSGKPAELDYEGEKTPSNMFHMGQLLDWYPDARILVIFRDPLAVLQSEVNKDVKPDYPVARSSRLYPYGLVVYVLGVWLIGYLAALYYKTRYPDNIQFVRYEGLAGDVDASAGKIFAWLGLAYEADATRVKKVDSSYAGAEASRIWRAPRWVRGLYMVFLGWIRRSLDRRAIN